jgi:2-methylcitrate dehydratase PrpD
LPQPLLQAISQEILDVIGLCLAARNSDYVGSIVATREGAGNCTAIGHPGGFAATDAALINGTAAHGEDYDDTFEGSPAHPGAVVVPAVLAACEAHNRSGADLLRGVAIGGELVCRMSIAAPGAVHRAGFHPTAVIGTMGAALGVSTALSTSAPTGASALGVAGSFAAGIIEYLSEGTWTKRIHAGWAARCGLEAVALAKAGFLGPRTVFEGPHGFYHGFTNGDVEPNLNLLTEALGQTWHLQRVAFKPYACGTMTQPYIDCAIRLREQLRDQGRSLQSITSIECKAGAGTVHRLWEPLSEKRAPTTPYSAKFSVPYCIAVGLVDGAAGLEQFTEHKVRDTDVLSLAQKVSYSIDPDNEYPRNYSGHLRVTFADGAVIEVEQPHMRGGARERLTQQELEAKFAANARYGRLTDGASANARQVAQGLLGADNVNDLQSLRN